MLELPGYKIIKEIGRGGMAKVYLARHEGLDRDVAIKVMFPNLATDSSYSERFIREARIVAKLSHHNIVTVFDVGIFEQYHYIAMEFLPGITLDDKIKSGISDNETLSVIKQVCAGLYYAHEKGFIHRDIKPENIMFRENGSAVITDFGIARATKSETKMTAVGTVIGTAHYMSPEQAQGQELTPCSDIYSIGIMLYEMLTGKVPYDADSTIAIVFKHIDAPIPELEGEQAKYQTLLNKLMAKQPMDRYQSCQEIIHDIEDIEKGNKPTRATEFYSASELGENAKETQLIDAIPSAKKSRTGIIIGALLAISAVTATGFYFFQQTGNDSGLPVADKPSASQQLAIEQQLKAQQQQDQRQQEAERKRREQALIEATKKAILEEQEANRLQQARQLKQKLAQEEAAQKARSQRLAEMRQRAAKKQAQEKKKIEQQKKISSLLQQADNKLLNKKLNEAYRLYRRALKLDHKNRHAVDGIQQVASLHLKLAHSSALKNQFEDADKHIQTVINIAPAHAELSRTQNEIFKLKSQYQKAQLDKELQLRKQQLSKKQPSTKTEKAPAEEAKKPQRRSFGSF